MWLGQRNVALAIDITDRQVSLVCLDKRPGRSRIMSAGIKRLLPGADSQAVITDFINDFLRHYPVKTTDVSLSLFLTDALFCQILAMPDLPAEEIDAAAPWQLKHLAPFDPLSALLSWQVVRTFKDEEGARKKEILFVLLKRDVVERYMEILKSCRLSPRVITSGFVNYGWILNDFKPVNGPAVVLDVGDSETMLGFYNGGQLVFARPLPFSWDKMTKALTEMIIADKGKIQLTAEEAEDIKNKTGIPREDEGLLFGKVQPTQVLALMRPLLETLAQEIKFSLNYFVANLEQEKPREIFLTGMGANLRNLDLYLGKELGLPVSFLPLPTIKDNHEEKNATSFYPEANKIVRAIGAYWGRGRGINFLTAEMRREQEFQRRQAFLRLTGIIGMIFLFFDVFLLNAQNVIRERKLEALRVQAESMRIVDSLKIRVTARADLAARLQKGDVPLETLLKEISSLTPADIILSEMVLDHPAHSIILKGVTHGAAEETTLTDFIEDLERVAVFGEVSLVSSRKEGSGQAFEIRCAVKKE